MNDKIITSLITTGGLIVGWTLNELGVFFKTFRENKKVHLQILYKQLEIRDVIIKTDISAIQSQIENLLVEKLPSDQNRGGRDVIGQVFNGFIQNELNNRFGSNIKILIKDYSDCLITLSQIDPFTTYYIGNKDTTLDYLAYIDEYLKGIEEYLNKTAITDEDSSASKEERSFSEIFSSIRSHVTPLIRESALETIEADLLLISKRIGFRTHLKTKKFMKQTEQRVFNVSDVNKLESYINSVITRS